MSTDKLMRNEDSRKKFSYFETIMNKYENRNRDLEEQEKDLRIRLDVFQRSFPILMFWNMSQIMQGTDISCADVISAVSNSLLKGERIHGEVSKEVNQTRRDRPLTAPSGGRRASATLKEIEEERAQIIEDWKDAENEWKTREQQLQSKVLALEYKTKPAEKELQTYKQNEEKFKRRIRELENLLYESEKYPEELDVTFVFDPNSGVATYNAMYQDQQNDGIRGVPSLNNKDLETMKRLQELVHYENALKKRITEMEKKEKTYLEMWSDTESPTSNKMQIYPPGGRNDLGCICKEPPISDDEDNDPVLNDFRNMETNEKECLDKVFALEKENKQLLMETNHLRKQLQELQSQLEERRNHVEGLMKTDPKNKQRWPQKLDDNIQNVERDMRESSRINQKEVSILQDVLHKTKKDLKKMERTNKELKAKIETLLGQIKEKNDELERMKQMIESIPGRQPVEEAKSVPEGPPVEAVKLELAVAGEMVTQNITARDDSIPCEICTICRQNICVCDDDRPLPQQSTGIAQAPPISAAASEAPPDLAEEGSTAGPISEPLPVRNEALTSSETPPSTTTVPPPDTGTAPKIGPSFLYEAPRQPSRPEDIPCSTCKVCSLTRCTCEEMKPKRPASAPPAPIETEGEKEVEAIEVELAAGDRPASILGAGSLSKETDEAPPPEMVEDLPAAPSEELNSGETVLVKTTRSEETEACKYICCSRCKCIGVRPSSAPAGMVSKESDPCKYMCCGRCRCGSVSQTSAGPAETEKGERPCNICKDKEICKDFCLCNVVQSGRVGSIVVKSPACGKCVMCWGECTCPESLSVSQSAVPTSHPPPVQQEAVLSKASMKGSQPCSVCIMCGGECDCDENKESPPTEAIEVELAAGDRPASILGAGSLSKETDEAPPPEMVDDLPAAPSEELNSGETVLVKTTRSEETEACKYICCSRCKCKGVRPSSAPAGMASKESDPCNYMCCGRCRCGSVSQTSAGPAETEKGERPCNICKDKEICKDFCLCNVVQSGRVGSIVVKSPACGKCVVCWGECTCPESLSVSQSAVPTSHPPPVQQEAVLSKASMKGSQPCSVCIMCGGECDCDENKESPPIVSLRSKTSSKKLQIATCAICGKCQEECTCAKKQKSDVCYETSIEVSLLSKTSSKKLQIATCAICGKCQEECTCAKKQKSDVCYETSTEVTVQREEAEVKERRMEEPAQVEEEKLEEPGEIEELADVKVPLSQVEKTGQEEQGVPVEEFLDAKEQLDEEVMVQKPVEEEVAREKNTPGYLRPCRQKCWGGCRCGLQKKSSSQQSPLLPAEKVKSEEVPEPTSGTKQDVPAKEAMSSETDIPVDPEAAESPPETLVEEAPVTEEVAPETAENETPAEPIPEETASTTEEAPEVHAEETVAPETETLAEATPKAVAEPEEAIPAEVETPVEVAPTKELVVTKPTPVAETLKIEAAPSEKTSTNVIPLNVIIWLTVPPSTCGEQCMCKGGGQPATAVSGEAKEPEAEQVPVVEPPVQEPPPAEVIEEVMMVQRKPSIQETSADKKSIKSVTLPPEEPEERVMAPLPTTELIKRDSRIPCTQCTVVCGECVCDGSRALPVSVSGEAKEPEAEQVPVVEPPVQEPPPAEVIEEVMMVLRKPSIQETSAEKKSIKSVTLPPEEPEERVMAPLPTTELIKRDSRIPCTQCTVVCGECVCDGSRALPVSILEPKESIKPQEVVEEQPAVSELTKRSSGAPCVSCQVCTGPCTTCEDEPIISYPTYLAADNVSMISMKPFEWIQTPAGTPSETVKEPIQVEEALAEPAPVKDASPEAIPGAAPAEESPMELSPVEEVPTEIALKEVLTETPEEVKPVEQPPPTPEEVKPVEQPPPTPEEVKPVEQPPPTPEPATSPTTQTETASVCCQGLCCWFGCTCKEGSDVAPAPPPSLDESRLYAEPETAIAAPPTEETPIEVVKAPEPAPPPSDDEEDMWPRFVDGVCSIELHEDLEASPMTFGIPLLSGRDVPDAFFAEDEVEGLPPGQESAEPPAPIEESVEPPPSAEEVGVPLPPAEETAAAPPQVNAWSKFIKEEPDKAAISAGKGTSNCSCLGPGSPCVVATCGGRRSVPPTPMEELTPLEELAPPPKEEPLVPAEEVVVAFEEVEVTAKEIEAPVEEAVASPEEAPVPPLEEVSSPSKKPSPAHGEEAAPTTDLPKEEAISAPSPAISEKQGQADVPVMPETPIPTTELTKRNSKIPCTQCSVHCRAGVCDGSMALPLTEAAPAEAGTTEGGPKPSAKVPVDVPAEETPLPVEEAPAESIPEGVSEEASKTVVQEASELQSAMSMLEKKCQNKNQIIAALATELKVLAESSLIDQLCDSLAADSPEPLRDFDRDQLCEFLRKSDGSPSKVQLKQQSERVVCPPVCPGAVNRVDTSIPPPLGLHVLCRVGQNGLMLGWNNPHGVSFVGYEVFVNGALKQKVHSSTRNKAVLQNLDLSKKVIISLYGVTTRGVCSQPASISYPDPDVEIALRITTSCYC